MPEAPRSERIYDRIMRTMFDDGPDGEEPDNNVGQIAVSKRYVTGEQLGECLRDLKALRDRGETAHVGMVLLRHGYLSMEQYLEILAAQEEQGKLPEPSDRAGKYRLVREIAHGGMGTVYEAEDPELKRRVALKIIRETEENREVIARLHREAAIAAQLRHPNIVGVHEVGVAQDPSGKPIHFIAMDFVAGRTLQEVIGDPNTSLRERLRMLEEVARAVGYAHAQGVLHRDLKPANVLVDGDGRAVLTDFGLAHAESFRTRLTRSFEVLGTPQYMAPEQVEGRTKEIDAKTDLYALGVMLYEVLTGKPPFRAETPAKLYRQILQNDPARPSGIRSSVPRDLEVVCLKAMAKERERRYASAEAFAEDLARFRRGEPIAARPPSLGYRLRKRLARWKVSIVAGSAAALCVAAILLLLIPKLRQTQARLRAEQAAQESERARAERYRWLQEEKIKPLLGKMYETRILFYVPHTDVGARLREIVGAVDELTGLTKDLSFAGYSELWVILGMAAYFVGDRARAEEALHRAEALAPNDPRVKFYLGKIYVEYLLADWVVGWGGSWTPHAGRSKEYAKKILHYFQGEVGGGFGAEAIDRHIAAAYCTLAEKNYSEMIRLCYDGLRRFRDESGNELLGTEEFWGLLGLVCQEDVAVRACDRALARRPHYAWGYLMRGRLRNERGDYKGALEDSSELVRINPRYPDHHFGLGSRLANYAESLAAQGRQAEARSAWEEAVRSFSRAIEILPEFNEAYECRGDCYKRLGDPDAALKDYAKIMAVWPENHRVWVSRGIIKGEQGDVDGAIADFTESIRLLSHQLDAYRNRAVAWIQKREWEKAVADLSEAIRLDSTQWELYPKRALARKASGDTEGARSDEVRMLDFRGRARQKAGDLDGAITDFTKAIELDPNYAAAYYCRGSAREAKRDWEGVIADYTKVIELDPDWNKGLYVNRGLAKEAKGDRDGAIADYTKAIDLDSKNAWAYNNRGMARLNRGDADGAIADCTKAIELNPTYPAAHNNRGHAKKSKGDLEGAIAEYTRAIEIDPENALAYFSRAQARKDRGDPTGAVEDLQQALEVAPADWPLHAAAQRLLETLRGQRGQDR